MIKAKKSEELHKSVLVDEVLECFGILKTAHLNKELKIIDATLGLGGHTLSFVKRGAIVLGIDDDYSMLKLAQERLDLACPTPNRETGWGSFKLVHGNFRNIEKIAKQEGFTDVSGILFDLGVSSPQLISQERGFSFQNDSAVLDMRISTDSGVKGFDLLNTLRVDQLFTLFNEVIPLPTAKDIAKRVVEKRKYKPFYTVGDFKEVLKNRSLLTGGVNFATLPFLALRLAVNSEIENLNDALKSSLDILSNNGRIAVISFHSGEDKVVKNIFKNFSQEGYGEILTKKPIIPKEEEIKNNPRSRSAKLRIFEKK